MIKSKLREANISASSFKV